MRRIIMADGTRKWGGRPVEEMNRRPQWDKFTAKIKELEEALVEANAKIAQLVEENNELRLIPGSKEHLKIKKHYEELNK